MKATRQSASASKAVYFLAGSVVVLVTAGVSLCFGSISISPTDVILSVIGNSDSQSELIVQKLRVPRTLLALGVGALMGVSGAMTQGLFRNPLADPSLIGISAGASAGASIVIVFLHNVVMPVGALSLISLGAFFGGLLAVLLVYRFATGENGTSVSTMLLAGIAVSFIAGSLSTALEFVADNDMLRQLSLWKMGGLDSANMTQATLVLSVLFIISWILPFLFPALNALLLGESEARHLGFDTQKLKYLIVVIVAAAVGASVSMAGMIAFVGLVVPHIVRMLVGPNHNLVVPLSGLGGAWLLVVADSFSRTIIAPSELPLGLVTTVIGVPIFISLLRRRHHYGMH